MKNKFFRCLGPILFLDQVIFGFISFLLSMKIRLEWFFFLLLFVEAHANNDALSSTLTFKNSPGGSHWHWKHNRRHLLCEGVDLLSNENLTCWISIHLETVSRRWHALEHCWGWSGKLSHKCNWIPGRPCLVSLKTSIVGFGVFNND